MERRCLNLSGEVKMDGLNDLLRNIDILKDKTVTAQASGMAQVCIDVADYAKANHPFQNQTTNLENSIQPLPVEIEDEVVTGYVRAGMEYSVYVEFTHPYMEPAKEANKKNLIDTMAATQQRAQQAVKVEK